MSVLIRHTDVLGGGEPQPGGTVKGGIVGGWPPLSEFAGWRTYGVQDIYTDPSGAELPIFRMLKTDGPKADTVTQVARRASSHFVARAWPHATGTNGTPMQATGSFPGLAWYLMDPSSMALVAGPLLPLGNNQFANIPTATLELMELREHYLQWYSHTVPIAGPYIGVLVAREPSPDFPLWVSGHPVDLATHLLDQKGEAWDPVTAAAVRTALGPELGHQAAITTPDKTLQDVVDGFSAAYGFAIRRSGTTGAAEFVRWRDKVGPTLPAPVLDMNSLRSL